MIGLSAEEARSQFGFCSTRSSTPAAHGGIAPHRVMRSRGGEHPRRDPLPPRRPPAPSPAPPPHYPRPAPRSTIAPPQPRPPHQPPRPPPLPSVHDRGQFRCYLPKLPAIAIPWHGRPGGSRAEVARPTAPRSTARRLPRSRTAIAVEQAEPERDDSPTKLALSRRLSRHCSSAGCAAVPSTSAHTFSCRGYRGTCCPLCSYPRLPRDGSPCGRSPGARSGIRAATRHLHNADATASSRASASSCERPWLGVSGPPWCACARWPGISMRRRHRSSARSGSGQARCPRPGCTAGAWPDASSAGSRPTGG